MRIRSYEKEADFYELCDFSGILPSISKLTVNRREPRRFAVEFHADENELFRLRDGLGLRNVTSSLIESKQKEGFRVYALDHSLSPLQVSGGREFVEVILNFTEQSQTASLELVYSDAE